MSEYQDEVATVPTTEMCEADSVYLVHSFDARINKLFEQTLDLEETVKADEQEVQRSIQEIDAELKTREPPATAAARWYKKYTSVLEYMSWIKQKFKRRAALVPDDDNNDNTLQLTIPALTTMSSIVYDNTATPNIDDGESIVTNISDQFARTTGHKYRQLLSQGPQGPQQPDPETAGATAPAPEAGTTADAATSTDHDRVMLEAVPMARASGPGSRGSRGSDTSSLRHSIRRGVTAVISRAGIGARADRN